MFDEITAAIWSARARRELGPISGRAAGGRDELTATECQIADLVATGKRTVESNLTRICSKLGVRSRGQPGGAREPGY